MDSLLQDVRAGLRNLLRAPLVTAVALLAIGLGIGANTAVFSAVNAVLLRPLPYRDGDRLVRVWAKAENRPKSPVQPGVYEAIQARTRSFESIGSSRDVMFTLSGDGDPEQLIGYRFEPAVWATLGVQPKLGRVLTAEEEKAGHAVVLSDALFSRRFRRDPSIVGRTITLEGQPTLVTGVMPETFQLPAHAELWAPLELPANLIGSFETPILRLVARLRPSVTIAEAQRELSALSAALRKEHPELGAQFGLDVVDLRQDQTGDIRPALLLLLGAVGFVLLVACADVASLLLARAAARRGELAVRAALGASRGRLIRQLLTESALLGAAGGALGLLIAVWSTGPLLLLFPRNQHNVAIPVLDELPIDGTVLAFAAGLSVVSCLVFGLLPAALGSRLGLREALQESTGAGQRSGRVRGALLVAEVAAAVVLLCGAGLLARSLQKVLRADLGFDPRGVATGRVMLFNDRYKDPRARAAFAAELEKRLRALPGVEAAGIANLLPLSGWSAATDVWADGTPRPRPGEQPEAHFRTATPGWHGAVRSTLIAGRAFTDLDGPQAAPVAIVSASLARRLWPDAAPAQAIGRRLRSDLTQSQVLTVVGVIRDLRQLDPTTPAADEIEYPFAQVPSPVVGVAVRGGMVPALLAAIRREVTAIDPERPVSFALGYEEMAADVVAPRTVVATLVGLLAAMALLLAALGIYGLLSYAVVVRTREIGVRVALGASTSAVLQLFVGGGLKLALCGLGLGLCASLALSRLLASLLYEVSPADPLILAGVCGILLGAALLASFLPALRASRLPPLTALRS